MIIGIGIDIVDVSRIENILDAKFIARVFTHAEQQTCEARTNRANAYAKRFAAKEACAKALGCGIGRDCAFTDIELTNDERGAPHITLSGAAFLRLQRLTPKDKIANIFVSLADEKHTAIAQVIIEA